MATPALPLGNPFPIRSSSRHCVVVDWINAALLLAMGLLAVPSSVSAQGEPFQLGDVFVAVANGKVQHRRPDGTLVQTLDTLQGHSTTGMAFDTVGNLYVANFCAGNVRKFDNRGNLIGTFGNDEDYSGCPESIVFDRNGNAYVGSVDGDSTAVRKFDPMGNLLAIFDVQIEDRGSDWIDLAADQCTLFYTSEGRNVKRFNVCSNTQLANFNTQLLPDSVAAYALRILPNGNVLVADTSVIVLLDSAGNRVGTTDAPGENCWFALNLDPDGKTFWSADFCSSNVYRFDIETGLGTFVFNTGTSTNPPTVFGLVTYGEITVGRPSGLRATVGNERVYLDWDPALEPIDGYNIHVARLDNNVFVPLGTVNPPETLIQGTRFRVFGFANGEFPENGKLYRFHLTAVKNGVEGPPSAPIFAMPNAYATLISPVRPVLFLHGIASDATTWDTTKDFLTSTLTWTFGGELRSEPEAIEATFQNGFVNRSGDFFTATFGNRYADYADLTGIAHQGREVRKYLDVLQSEGIPSPLMLVAHSMGGLAARHYLVNNSVDASQKVLKLITYGTPHRGVDLAHLRSNPVVQALAFFIEDVGRTLESQGAQDMDANCGGTPSAFLRDLGSNNLPDLLLENDYVAIVGHNHFLLTDYFSACFLSQNGIMHTDGVVPASSADLSHVASQPIQVLGTSKFHVNYQTSHIGAILCALDPNCLRLQVRSPVDIEAQAPGGGVIRRDLVSIPGASYEEVPEEGNELTASVLIPFPQEGNYRIVVTPKPGALPTDTFTLTATHRGMTTVLAQDMPIQNIPEGGFVFTVELEAPPPAPTINSGGVVNSASFAPGAGMAPGSIAAVFGTNLANPGVASAIPLPTTLGGSTMQFTANAMSFPVPQFFASPLQSNVQIPWELSGQASAMLADTVAGFTSAGEVVSFAPFSPGLFATNQAGTGQGAILIANTAMLAAPMGMFPGSRPAERGVDFLEIYWTGGGPVAPPVPTGTAASANPLSVAAKPTLTIGGVVTPVLFSGLAPGFVGLYVVTCQVQPGTPSGDAVPVVVTIGGVQSNTVTIAVQ